MTALVSFPVYGLPAPQGSKRPYVRGGKAMLVESSKYVRPWRQDVKAAAEEQRSGRLRSLDGPLGVSLVFTLPKPKSAPKTRRTWPQRRPDLDKLIRSTLDGLTGALFDDDAQIVMLQAAKCFPGEHDMALDRPGVFVSLWEVDGDA